MGKAPVLILLGSESDMPLMQDGVDFLKEMGVGFVLDIASAHRHPEKTAGYAKSAREKGIEVIVAAAGLAAAVEAVAGAFIECTAKKTPLGSWSCAIRPPPGTSVGP